MIRKFLVIFGSIGVVLLVGIVLIGGVFMLGPKPPKRVANIQAPAVFYIEAQSENVNLSVTSQGEVRPKTQINLTTQVAGKIQSVSDKFADGGSFEKGDVLVRIEPDDYQVNVIRAEASVAQAEQALKLAEAEAALAQKDWEELGGSNDGSPSPLTLRLPQLNQARANYDAAKADLNGAKLSLSRTKIKAPFQGRVREKTADLGQYVGPGSQLGRIFSTDVAEVRLPMTDDDLARLDLPLAFTGKGPKVDFSAVVAGKERHWSGNVVRTDAAIDAGTRQISVIAQVNDPYATGSDNGFPMAVGLFVSAKIKGPELEKVYVVPSYAIQNDNSLYYVTDDNTVGKTTVTIAASTPLGSVVTSGIKEDMKLIVSRLGKARVGDEVRALPQSGRSKTETANTAETSSTGAE